MLPTDRVVLGLTYCGESYHGWQIQAYGVITVQQLVESALSKFLDHPVSTICSGRTDAGVHALQQVIHFDTNKRRNQKNWIQGVNRYLPRTIAVQWMKQVSGDFDARLSALSRQYEYIFLNTNIRPSLGAGRIGFVPYPLDQQRMLDASQLLLGEHDFSAFRSSQCQAKHALRTLYNIAIERHGEWWRLRFCANAFLHHMVRNIMGCLIQIGRGKQDSQWLVEVLASKNRELCAPTFMADGLYFLGAHYPEQFALPIPSTVSLFSLLR